MIAKLLMLALMLGACFVLSSCDPSLTLNPKYTYTSFGLELGETIPADIAEYVDLSGLSDEDRQFVLDNTQLLYDDEPVDGQIFDSAGNHTLTIMYKGHQYRRYTIDIVDNEAPVFTETHDLTTYVGDVLSEDDLESMFDVIDNSGKVKLSVSDMDVDYNSAGDYTVKAVAEDPSGNKAEATATVTVEAPSYGMGGTYIWVSIADQQLSYFVDGQLALSSPVVTGNAGNHDTPTGEYSVIYKARNVNLKGLEDNGEENTACTTQAGDPISEAVFTWATARTDASTCLSHRQRLCMTWSQRALLCSYTDRKTVFCMKLSIALYFC